MIRLKDVEMEYPNGTRAIRGISTTIEDGEFVFLVGPSGSGKSTIIKMLTGEEIPTAGRIMINGFSVNNIAERQIPMMRRTLGIIFQDFRLIEKKTVYENLEFVMRAVGMPMKEIKNRIAYVLLLVGLEQKAESYPNELSGGEQQRVAIARALVNNPSTIIADEPTGNIDPETSYRLVELLKDICDSGKTVVIATHQYDLIKHFPGKVFRCENGVLQEDFSFAENQAAMTTIISENSVIDIESLTEEIEEPTVVHEVISLNEDPEILSPTEPTLQEMQEITLVTEDSEITDSTTILIEEKMTEEPQDASEENISSENDKTKKKDDNGPDFVGFELI